MGREFEAKVLISADEFIDLIRECGLTFSHKKSDIYWSKYASIEEAIKNGESLTRIRTEEENAFLTLKQKNKTDGFENNKEYETRVLDINVLQKLLEEAGYSPYFKKYKTSYMLKNTVNRVDVHTEIEMVENSTHPNKETYKRFYAIEIEAIPPVGVYPDDEELIAIVKEEFSKYGKTEADFETRSWRELLS